jgi:hypothetical protein
MHPPTQKMALDARVVDPEFSKVERDEPGAASEPQCFVGSRLAIEELAVPALDIEWQPKEVATFDRREESSDRQVLFIRAPGQPEADAPGDPTSER